MGSYAPGTEKYSTIILNRSNVKQDPDGYYNILSYDFGKTVSISENSFISWSDGALYYNWPNIVAKVGNNTLSYIWIDGTTHVVTIPDGDYQVSDIDQYIKFTMLQNSHYFIQNDATVTFVGNIFPIVFSANNVYNSIVLTIIPIPSGTQAAANHQILPPGATWTFPASPITPQVVITSATFGELIGFVPGTYPPTPIATTYEYQSSITPEIEPQSSVLVTCTLVNNAGFSSANMLDVFYAFTPVVEPGSKTRLENVDRMWYPIQPREYRDFEIRLYDQNRVPLRLKDPEVFAMLTIRQTFPPPSFNEGININFGQQVRSQMPYANPPPARIP